MPPAPKPSSATKGATQTQSRRRTTGERDRARGEITEDPAERRRDQARRQRYERQRARAIERGEPTSVGEALDQSYDAGFDKGQKQKARSDATSSLRLSNMPAGSLGIGSMVAPLVVETVLITADEFIRFHRWPIPSRYLAAFFIFGGLSLASGTQASQAASVTAWGLVLATTYAFVSNGSDVLAGVGNFFGGAPSKNANAVIAPIPNAPPTTAQIAPVA